MKENGNGWGTWKASVLILLLGALLGTVGTLAKVCAHPADTSIHHTVQGLDQRYATRELLDADIAALKMKIEELDNRNERIEAKLDRLLERGSR